MPAETSVADVMTRTVHTLHADDAITAAADRMSELQVGAMPVVDADGRLVGLLRDEDLIVSEARLHVPTTISFLGAALQWPPEVKRFEEELRRVAGATVGDVMTEDPVTVTADQTVEDLATVMHESDVTHVPVVDAGGRVVGIVARGDLVRLIARTT
jgi:CBS domain-containing protein